MKSEGS